MRFGRRVLAVLVVVSVAVAGCATAVGLPITPPTSPDCQGAVKAQEDIPHPTLGTVRLFLVLNSSTAVLHRGCVAAVAANGTVLPTIPIDVSGDSLNFANPVTDATGNAFITYNPGRYDGVLVLVSTPDGFQDIGWSNPNVRYYGKRAYYDATLEGPGPDGKYTIRTSTNDCIPSCAGGTVTNQDLHWDGSDYVA